VTTIEQLFGARTSVIIPDVVGAATTAELRALLEAHYVRFGLLDRGSYHVANDPDVPEVLAALTKLATEVTGRSLAISETRALRLRAGDYILAHHDRIHDDHPVELMLDLSPESVPGAEVHYRRRGQVFFRFPCTPGALSIVERGPTLTCNHTYVSKRYAPATVVRLIALLRG
jgi:hypothetical protein